MATSYLQMLIWTRYPVYPEPSKDLSKSSELQYHPLLDLLILQKVFNFTNTKDLLKIRLVCTDWNFEGCKHLRQRLNYKRIQDDSDASKFLKVSKNSQLFPVESFYIKILRMNKTHLELFNSVVSQHSIVTLKVSVSSNDFPSLLTNIVQLRNLKTLVVQRNPEDSIESVFITRDSPITFRTFTTCHSPQLMNLESICFKNVNPKKRFLCNYTSFIVSFLKSAGNNVKQLEFYYWSTPLTKIFRQVRLNKLNSLVVEGRTLGHMDITLLTMKTFSSKLKRLEICVDKNVKKESMTELMDSLAETLVEYKIT